MYSYLVNNRFAKLSTIAFLLSFLGCCEVVYAKDVKEDTNAQSSVSQKKSDTANSPMDLPALWSEALLNNPQLRQMREAYLSAKAVGPQVNAPSNPMVGFIWKDLKSSAPLALGAAGGGSYQITQPFQFPGKKSLAADVVDTQAEAMFAQNEQNALQLASQLSNAYYSAIAAQKQLIVLREAVLRLEIIKNLTKSRYANNAAAYTEFLNAQVAQSAAESDKFAMERQVDVALKTINTLIGHDPREKLLLISGSDSKYLKSPNLAELEKFAEESHPILKSSQLQLDAARKQLKLSQMSYLPDFQIVATTNQLNGPMTGNNPIQGYQLELDLIVPLFFFMKERYGVEQAVRNQNAYEMNDLALRQQVVLGVGSAHAAYEQSRNQVLFLRDRQVPESMAAYKVALNAYANNGKGYNDLLVAQNQLRSLQVQLAVAESALAQNYAALLAASGKDPISR